MVVAVGDILKEQLLDVEWLLVKEDEDIEKGEVCYNDGNGMLAAPNTVVASKFYIALKAHDYDDTDPDYHDENHYVPFAALGYIAVQKVAGTAIKQGDLVMIGATAGEINLYVHGDWPTSFDEAQSQAIIDNMMRIIGTCGEDVASDVLVCKVWVGVK